MVLRNRKLGTTCFSLALSLGLLPSGLLSTKAEAAVNSFVPELQVYRQGNSAKVEVGIDINNNDIFAKTSFEGGDTIPVISGSGDTSTAYGNSNGHQSISTDTASTGSNSMKLVDTVSGRTGNAVWYPNWGTDRSMMNFNILNLPNNAWVSLTFKMKTVSGDSNSQGVYKAGKTKQGLVLTDNSGRTVKFSQVTDFNQPWYSFKVYTDSGEPDFPDGKMIRIVMGKGTNYDYDYPVWWRYNKATQSFVYPMSKTNVTSNPLWSTFSTGETVLCYHGADIWMDNRSSVADSQWHTFSSNVKLTDPYYDFGRGITPGLYWSTNGTAYIDDVKFGYASKVNVYRDGVQIYSDYGSDITDSGVSIKPNAPTVTSINVGKATAQISFSDADKSETHVYTANAVSNQTGDISATSNPVTLTMNSKIAGYSYVLDNNAGTVPSNSIMTTGTNLTVDSSKVDLTKPVYIHIKAIDTNGLVSDTTHYMYSNATAQTSADAKSAIQNILPSIVATNAMTNSSLLSTLNNSVDTGYITLGISNFSLTPATETASGSVTGTVTIADKLGGTATVPINLTIAQLNQSLDTLVSLYNSALGSFHATNSTTANDIVSAVNIPYQDVSASMTGFSLTPATETASGSITGNIVITKGSDTRTIPVNLVINQLNQSLDTIASLYISAFPNVAISNSTTASDIKNCVNVPYSDVSVSVTNFNVTPATETSEGVATGSVDVTQGTQTKSVPFSLKIGQLGQSLDTIASLYTNALNKCFATNGTTANDLRKLVNVPYLDVAVSINNFTLTPATELTDGSITGEVLIQKGADYRSVPINLTIKHLPLGLANAVKVIQGKLTTESPTNTSTYGNILDDISSVVTNPQIHVSWSVDNPADFSRKDSTEQTLGYVKGTLDVSDGTTTIKLPVNLDIAKLPQTVNGTAQYLQAKVGSFTATNSTTEADVLSYISADTSVIGSYTVKFSTDAGKEFDKVLADYNNEGKITGTVCVSDGISTVEIPINSTIAKLIYTPTTAKIVVNTNIGTIKVTNDSTAQEILDKIKAGLPSYMDVKYIPSASGNDITKVSATTDADGSISGVIRISDGTSSTDVPFNFKIDKLPSTPAQEAKKLCVNIPSVLTVTNDSTEQTILDYIKGVVPSGITASFNTNKPFNKVYATYSEDGSITGTVIFKDAQGNTDSLDLNLVIAKVSGSGSSNHHSSGGSSGGSSSDSNNDTNGNTDGTNASNGVKIPVSMRDGADGTSYKMTQSTATVNDSELRRLFGDTSKFNITSYNWEAYKNNILVNSGTLSVVQDATKCLGVYINANSPLDKETSIDILVPNNVVNGLSNVYTYNGTLAKYVKSESSITNVNDVLTFTGTNKQAYLVTNEQLSQNILAYQGWNSLPNGSDWAYLKGENCVTSWKFDGQHWYFMDSNKVMKTGWIKPDGSWYYLNPVSDGTKGSMKTGWLKDNGSWYYLRSSGDMVTGWYQVDNEWYYFNNSGAMLHDTIVEGYILGSDGRIK